MIIHRLHLRNFACHEDTSLELPRRGLVLVRGRNGSGKSSIINACLQAMWGETLRRGHDPWIDGVAGAVVVGTSLGEFECAHSKSNKESYAYCLPPSGAMQRADTPTKTRRAIAEVVGSAEDWRRLHVLTSADAGIVDATDAQRKDIIERALRLSRFAPAYDAALKQEASSEREVFKLRTRVQFIRAQLPAMRARVDGMEPAPEPERPDLPGLLAEPALDPAEVLELEARLRQLEEAEPEELRQNRESLAQLHRTRAGLVRIDQDADTELARLRSGACPTCAREFEAPEQRIAQLEGGSVYRQAEIESYDASIQRMEQVVREGLAAWREDVVRSRGDLEWLRRRVAERAAVQQVYDAQVVAYETRAAAHAEYLQRYEEQARKAREELEREEAALFDADAELFDAESALARDAAITKTLSPAGFRARVLAGALDAITQRANHYLGLMCPGVTAQLLPYRDLASGGTNGDISLVIRCSNPRAFGGGKGYAGASGGERRRIGVAIMLALSEVADAASTREPGTLFLDEILDAVDADGIPLVVAAVREIARTRCVVLITHLDSIGRDAGADVRWQVEGGKVEVL